MRRVASVVGVIGAILFAPIQAGGQTIDWSRAASAESLLVRFRDDSSGAARARTHSSRSVAALRSFDSVPIDVVEVPQGVSIEELAADYAADPDVAYVQPNYIYSTVAVPNDPKFRRQWSLSNNGRSGGVLGADIGAVDAWDLQTGDSSVVVAVIDTGIDYDHSDLADNMWTNPGEVGGLPGVDDDFNGIVDDIYGARFLDCIGQVSNGDPFDDNRHGTHVAGIIGAKGNNGRGMAGVSHDVRLMGVKFLSRGGFGCTSDAVAAIEYAVAMGAVLTNNSWGGGGFDPALREAISAANRNGVLFVAAAGNSNSNNDLTPHYPSSYELPNVIAVASTDRADSMSSFSSFGPTSVDIGAPGSDILSTIPGGGYGRLSGTSMAAPHVAGAAALLLGHLPGAGVEEIVSLLLDNSDSLPRLAGQVVSGGRLNVANALAAANPSAGRVYFERDGYSCAAPITLRLRDADLGGTGSVQVLVESSLGDQETVTLSEDAAGVFFGSVSTRNDGVVASDGLLAVDHGVSLSATYEDADDGVGGSPTVVANATTDCIAPEISGVVVSDVSGVGATVRFETNEPTQSRIRFGTSCGQLPGLFELFAGTSSHEIELGGLESETTYFFRVEAEDAAGSVTTDDNGGVCYSFTTLFLQDYFTSLSHAPQNAPHSYEGYSLTFTPDGSAHYYQACRSPITAFPVDPTGSLPEPSFGSDRLAYELPVAGGLVHLYGQSYDRVFVSWWGSVTFDAPDDEDDNGFDTHFASPRVTALGSRHVDERGVVYSKELPDRLVVTYINVRDYSHHQEGDAQIELFFDGRIRLTTLSLHGDRFTFLGLSEGGGLPDDFIPSRFDELPKCGDPEPTSIPVEGRNLAITYKAKGTPEQRLVVRLQDPAIEVPTPGSASDPTVNGASLLLLNPTTGETDLHYLPPPYWSWDGIQYRFRDSNDLPRSILTGKHLPVPCKSVTISPGKFKASCKGEAGQGLYYSLDEPQGQGSIAAFVTTGAGTEQRRYCAVFGGKVKRDTHWDGRRRAKFKATKAPRPAECPPLP